MTTRDKWQLMVKTQSTREIYSLENEALCIWPINLSIVELERLLKSSGLGFPLQMSLTRVIYKDIIVKYTYNIPCYIHCCVNIYIH